MSEKKDDSPWSWLGPLLGVVGGIGGSFLLAKVLSDPNAQKFLKNLFSLNPPASENPQQIIYVPVEEPPQEERRLQVGYTRGLGGLRPKWSHSATIYDPESLETRDMRERVNAMLDRQRQRVSERLDDEIKKQREEGAKSGRFKLRYT